jgi:integrase
MLPEVSAFRISIPHNFHHWRVAQMLRGGVPIDQVQRYLNHHNIQSTQLYTKDYRAVDG